jgi:hypothetical protein
MLEQLYCPLIVTKNLDPPNLESDVSRSFLNQSASFTAAAPPMYLASTVKAATVGCSLLDQLADLPCMTNTYLVVERRESTLPA